MNKVAILIFALAISYASGACSTDLGTYLSVAVTSATASLGNTLDSCTSQEGQTSCCTTTLITGIKTSAATLQTALETAAGNRDKAILAARAKVGAQQANYALWLAAATAADTKLTEWTTTPPSGVTAQQVTDIKAAITDIKALWTDFFTDYTTLRTGFTTYQTDRSTCFTQLIKEATAAKCLACTDDSTFTNQGITVNSPTDVDITYGTALDTRMAAACRAYFMDSETQTNVFLIEQYAAGIEDMTAALVKIAAGTTAGAAEFLTAAATEALTGTPSVIDDTTCTVTTCPWLVSDVFVNGKLNNANLVQGGAATSRRRMLTERNLQTLTLGTGESKVTATFPTNPGSVVNVNDLSALRVGVFSCIAAFFVALLI